MPRDHERAAFLFLFGHGELDDPIERGNHAVDAAAVLGTNDG